MSSCLSGGGGRTYVLDLDLVKSPSLSSARSSSSSPSSTLSESSVAISTKRARTPRKRPNQSYTEAAALLSTIYPKLFSTKNLHKLCKHSCPFNSSLSSSDLLPPFPALNESEFLIENCSPDQKPVFRFEFKPKTPIDKPCTEFREPCSPSSSDYDVESILDEEVGEGIDSIMGNLSMNTCNDDNSNINPYLGSLMGFGFGGKFELGLGFGLNRANIRQALRRGSDGDWWRSTATVAVSDIVPKYNALPSLEKKKTKKKKKKVEKVEKEEVKNLEVMTNSTTSATSSVTSVEGDLKSGLGLKLNHEKVLNAWSDRGFPFSSESGSPESSAKIIARLADIDLFPDNGAGGVREASVQRYKEKRRTRLFSKKIRYQVRKVNADQRPRMKASGRFVRRPSLLHQAIEEDSQ